MFSWLVFNTLCALPLVLVALALRWFPRVPPALEHVLWVLVFVRLVLPPFAAEAAPPGVATPAIVASGPPGLGEELVASATRLFGPRWSSWGGDVLEALFAAVLLFVVARELWRARAVQRCVQRAAAAGPELLRRVNDVAAQLGVRAPSVRVSPEVSGPFLWSLRRPVLVLPACDAEPAAAILAHELAHLRRRDHWTAWLELAVQGFHFWNPLFWLARRHLHRAAELDCDRWAVKRYPGDRRTFAGALLDTAERAQRPPFVPRAAQALGTDARDFDERLLRILGDDVEAQPRQGLFAVAVLCAVLTVPGLGVPTLASFRSALPGLPAGTDHEHWRRVLAAAEERLRIAPDEGAAELQRGMALLGLGRARESLDAFQRQQELGHQPAKALYNQACALVRLGELEAAESCLFEAADLELDVAGYVAADPDLAVFRARAAEFLPGS